MHRSRLVLAEEQPSPCADNDAHTGRNLPEVDVVALVQGPTALHAGDETIRLLLGIRGSQQGARDGVVGTVEGAPRSGRRWLMSGLIARPRPQRRAAPVRRTC